MYKYKSYKSKIIELQKRPNDEYQTTILYKVQNHSQTKRDPLR